ncbi:pentapeptide repeat-containing protein, partial [Bradyrhizobium valentinum]|uniref:pentapeptide repeat-containing protein n=1 Tax=Bradyrhizobium valentinum TaxID=1518501 RepID=UPI000A48FC28
MSIDLLLQSVDHKFPVREANLDGQMLSGLSLNDGVVLSSSFRGSQFTRARLTGMTFQDCDFSGASFADGCLEKCIFVGCRAGGSDWRRARFTQSTFMSSDFSHSNFSETR